MKRLLFVTKSKLSQNLLEIIVKTLPKQIDYHTLSNFSDLNTNSLSKTIQLMIIDQNSLPSNLKNDGLWSPLQSKYLKNAKKILINNRNDTIDQDFLKSLGFSQFLTKPFLTEELIDVLQKYLGGKT